MCSRGCSACKKVETTASGHVIVRASHNAQPRPAHSNTHFHASPLAHFLACRTCWERHTHCPRHSPLLLPRCLVIVASLPHLLGLRLLNVLMLSSLTPSLAPLPEMVVVALHRRLVTTPGFVEAVPASGAPSPATSAPRTPSNSGCCCRWLVSVLAVCEAMWLAWWFRHKRGLG